MLWFCNGKHITVDKQPATYHYMTFPPDNEEDGWAHSSLSGNVATDKVHQMSQWLAVVFDTYEHAVTTQAVAGSSEVCPYLYVSVKYLDLSLVQSWCSEDLQHHSPITSNVTKTVNQFTTKYKYS